MVPFPRAPVGIPKSGKELALSLAGGVITGGIYLWKKWKEKNRMKTRKDYPASGPDSDEAASFGTMRTDSGKEISLKSVSLTGSIEGLLFSSTIAQEYKNETDEDLEIIYTFPVGINTCLLGMDARIGEKRLHGEVVKKEAAEEKYEAAIEKGDSAIMVQESSLGLYTANLGNIRPQETVVVEIHCAKLLSYDQGRIRIAIPTVIGERYGNEHCEGGLAAHETARADANASYTFSLDLSLKGELAEAQVECPTHKTIMERGEKGLAVILDSGARLDRDFVLLINGVAGTSHAQCVPDEEKWMACASFCPRMDNVEDNPLGLKILVDCSGSMSGMSIGQAQKGLGKILTALTPKDCVSYSRFGSNVRHMSKKMLPCDPDNMRKLSAAIEATEANMGGTEMEEAVLSTVRDIANGGDVPPVMLLITDGDIWEVKSLIESAKRAGHRIFVIGVGAAPAESVLYELARQTGGACEFVTENENIDEAIVRMFHRMRGKAAKNIHIEWPEKPVWQAELPQYIYDGETVHSFALFDNKPQCGPTLSWLAGDEEYNDKISALETSDNQDMTRLGRACQMRESLTDREKLAIALKYQLVSALTSLILVYERAEDDKIKGLPKIQQVPQMRAYGHGNYMNFCASSFAAFAATDDCVEIPTFLRRSADGICHVPATEIHTLEIHSLGDLVSDMAEIWQKVVLNTDSLADFIRSLERDTKYQPLKELVAELAKKTGLPKEAIYAVILERALQEAGEASRHSMRLLKPHLPAESEKESLLEELTVKM